MTDDTQTKKGIYVIEDGTEIKYRLRGPDANDYIQRNVGATMRFVVDGGVIHHNGQPRPHE